MWGGVKVNKGVGWQLTGEIQCHVLSNKFGRNIHLPCKSKYVFLLMSGAVIFAYCWTILELLFCL